MNPDAYELPQMPEQPKDDTVINMEDCKLVDCHRCERVKAVLDNYKKHHGIPMTLDAHNAFQEIVELLEEAMK